MKKSYRLLALLLAFCVLAGFSGCGGAARSTDLMKGIVPQRPSLSADADTVRQQNERMTDLAVRLLQACGKSGENTLLSPLSILCALGMTVNGAEGETLDEMERVLGLTAQQTNEVLCRLLRDLPQDGDAQLRPADAIWFKNDASLSVRQAFLQKNADYLGAEIRAAAFDEGTRREINRWVEKNTDGTIRDLLPELPPQSVMVLVNALAFAAKWGEPYRKNNITDAVFTTQDGQKRDARLMWGNEGMLLHGENAVGFMKPYAGGRYAFAALLPDEGVTLDEFVASLDGKALHAMLSAPDTDGSARVGIVQFAAEYGTELTEALRGMGMRRAFDPAQAQFGGIGTAEENISIGSVIHKTFLRVDANGTKAGAATAVTMRNGGSAPPQETIELTRPFLYLLVDVQSGVPFFIGKMADIGA